MKTLPAVDVVIVGGGWTGLLMAKELGSRTGLSVAVLERGASRESADYPGTMDELDYAVRLHMMQDLSLETVTVRHASTASSRLPKTFSNCPAASRTRECCFWNISKNFTSRGNRLNAMSIASLACKA